MGGYYKGFATIRIFKDRLNILDGNLIFSKGLSTRGKGKGVIIEGNGMIEGDDIDDRDD